MSEPKYDIEIQPVDGGFRNVACWVWKDRSRYLLLGHYKKDGQWGSYTSTKDPGLWNEYLSLVTLRELQEMP